VKREAADAFVTPGIATGGRWSGLVASSSGIFVGLCFVLPTPSLSACLAVSVAKPGAAEPATPGTRVSWDGSRADGEQPASVNNSGNATTDRSPINMSSLCGSRALTQARLRCAGQNVIGEAARRQSGLAQRGSLPAYCARNFFAT